MEVLQSVSDRPSSGTRPPRDLGGRGIRVSGKQVESPRNVLVDDPKSDIEPDVFPDDLAVRA